MALVADEFCSVPTEDMKLFMKAMRKYYMVQPQTYNTKDFSPDKNPFVAEILSFPWCFTSTLRKERFGYPIVYKKRNGIRVNAETLAGG